jgi:peptidoglycan/xylan/chitin deacetylase (PgdA/CDA1 family)
MSLDATYLEYRRRRHGYDHDLYDWSALKDRAPVVWPGGAKVAVSIVVSVEWFPMAPSDTPFRAPGHMQTVYPDYRHYTARDYGNRVGVWRLIEAFTAAGVDASFAVNSVIAERYPELVAAIIAGGHEIIAHATDMNGTIASGLDIDAEQALIETSFATLEQATGTRPRGWLSIARSESWNTLDLVKAAGGSYVCDWVNDELPYRFNNGLVNFPLNHELSDRQIINVQQQSVDSYATQMLDAFDWLSAEAAAGGRLLPMHVTPYIIALPYRIAAFERLLTELAGRGAWFSSAGRIVAAWAEQQR